jgi:hypothetical protein
MSKKLSEECIKAIEEVSVDKALNDIHARILAACMRLALTNPEIYTKADLVNIDDFKLPESFNSEPVLVILTNALKYLNNEQLKNLLTMISQRIPNSKEWTNPESLISKEDALGFAEWCEKSGYDYHESFEIWIAGIDKKTTEESLNIYLKQKQ